MRLFPDGSAPPRPASGPGDTWPRPCCAPSSRRGGRTVRCAAGPAPGRTRADPVHRGERGAQLRALGAGQVQPPAERLGPGWPGIRRGRPAPSTGPPGRATGSRYGPPARRAGAQRPGRGGHGGRCCVHGRNRSLRVPAGARLCVSRATRPGRPGTPWGMCPAYAVECRHAPSGGRRRPGRGGAFLPGHPMPSGTPSGGPWRTVANSRPATCTRLLSTQPRTWGLDVSGQPNTRLADLFGLAGWSKGELARLVNRQAAAMGHPQLATDTSRVRRWIDMGEIPRDPVPRVLAAPVHRASRPCRDHRGPRSGAARAVRGNGRATGSRNIPTVCRGRPNGPPRSSPEFTGMDLMLNRTRLGGRGCSASPRDPHSAAPCTTGCTPTRP